MSQKSEVLSFGRGSGREQNSTQFGTSHEPRMNKRTLQSHALQGVAVRVTQNGLGLSGAALSLFY